MSPFYRCLRCWHEWHGDKTGPTQCPRCDHLKVKWVNYHIWSRQ